MNDDVFTFSPAWRWLDRPPLHLETGLEGHVVVVLYWRLGCAHSRAALSELALASVRQRGRPVAFVAVHVPLEAWEDDDDRVRRQLAHLPAPLAAAVAPDAQGVERLPTMVLLDAAGEVQARAAGVPRRRRLRDAIDALVRQAEERGRAALVPFVPHETEGRGSLSPSALAHDGEHLWVASAAQRRVLMVAIGEAAAGAVVRAFGSGAWGKQDGDAGTCSFALPAALCAHEGFIAVADEQTHTLRAIDVAHEEVSTWVGTGQFGADDVGGAYGTDQALCSPAGVVSHDGGLYLCQAGVDQLWQVDPMTGAAMAWLGGAYGGEVLRQPAGLSQLDDQLWVAEAGAGALTCVDLAHVEVRGRQEGMLRPRAVAALGSRVFVADAAGGVVLERVDGALVERVGAAHGLAEPVGLAAAADGWLYIADVAADAVFVASFEGDADGPVGVRRLALTGLPQPARLRTGPRARVARPCQLAAQSDVTLEIAVPDVADGETVVVDVVDEATPVLAVPRDTVVEARAGRVEVLLPITDGLIGALRVRLQAAGQTTCYVVPVTVVEGGATVCRLQVD